jgi:hypothetical protein
MRRGAQQAAEEDRDPQWPEGQTDGLEEQRDE